MITAVQTYTVRKEIQNDLAGTLSKLTEFSIKHIELARVKFNGKMAAKIADYKKNHDLNLVSCQVKPKILFNNFERVANFCCKTECNAIVVSVMETRAILGGEKELFAFIGKLNGLHARCKEKGLTLAYHHHDWEFVNLGGRTRFDILVERLDPGIRFVVDTYWTQRCGIAPQERIDSLQRRLLGVHIRDFTVSQKFHRVRPRDCEIGFGTIDFSAVYAAAEKAGAAYCAIEQNSAAPFESLSQSIQYLKERNLFG
jgi:sugar phosphate isomerase/epimerase